MFSVQTHRMLFEIVYVVVAMTKTSVSDEEGGVACRILLLLSVSAVSSDSDLTPVAATATAGNLGDTYVCMVISSKQRTP